jgi:lipopolysaccharide transport system ATP-binding protein
LSGERATIKLRAEFARESKDPMVGMLIRNRLGIDVYGTNTRVEKKALGEFAAGDILEIDFAIDCLLSRGEYTLTVATQHADGASQDWVDDALSFVVIDPRDTAGLIQLNTEITWRRNP